MPTNAQQHADAVRAAAKLRKDLEREADRRAAWEAAYRRKLREARRLCPHLVSCRRYEPTEDGREYQCETCGESLRKPPERKPNQTFIPPPPKGTVPP